MVANWQVGEPAFVKVDEKFIQFLDEMSKKSQLTSDWKNAIPHLKQGTFVHVVIVDPSLDNGGMKVVSGSDVHGLDNVDLEPNVFLVDYQKVVSGLNGIVLDADVCKSSLVKSTDGDIVCI